MNQERKVDSQEKGPGSDKAELVEDSEDDIPREEISGYEEQFDKSRRRFIQLAVAGVGTASLGTLFSDQLVEVVKGSSDEEIAGVPVPKWGMVVDLDKCEGLLLCQQACQRGHYIPHDQQWLDVYKKEMNGSETPLPEPGNGSLLLVPNKPGKAPPDESYLPRPCMHCDNPPCRNVCPVGATFKRDDGLVLIDHNKCIGCRYCMAACPYDARVFHWKDPANPPEALAHTYSPEAPWPHQIGTVDKCDFCAHETNEGRLPHCVPACPNGVYYYGDLREDSVSNGREILRFTELIKTRGGFRLKAELGTTPRVWYLPRRGG